MLSWKMHYPTNILDLCVFIFILIWRPLNSMPQGDRYRGRALRLSVHDAAPGRRLAIVEVEEDATSSGAIAIGEVFRRILEVGAPSEA